jgi:hypothetical protein
MSGCGGSDPAVAVGGNVATTVKPPTSILDVLGPSDANASEIKALFPNKEVSLARFICPTNTFDPASKPCATAGAGETLYLVSALGLDQKEHVKIISAGTATSIAFNSQNTPNHQFNPGVPIFSGESIDTQATSIQFGVFENTVLVAYSVR